MGISHRPLPFDSAVNRPTSKTSQNSTHTHFDFLPKTGSFYQRRLFVWFRKILPFFRRWNLFLRWTLWVNKPAPFQWSENFPCNGEDCHTPTMRPRGYCGSTCLSDERGSRPFVLRRVARQPPTRGLTGRGRPLPPAWSDRLFIEGLWQAVLASVAASRRPASSGKGPLMRDWVWASALGRLAGRILGFRPGKLSR